MRRIGGVSRFLAEAEHAFTACWRLIRGDAAGLALLDLSIDGFWRSFRIALVLAICDSIDGWVGQSYAAAGSPVAAADRLLLVGLSAFASLAVFCVFPVAVGLLSRPMGIAARYAPYVIARNWLMLFLSLPVYVLNALSYTNVLPVEVLELLVLTYEVAILLAGYRIALAVLECPRTMAVGFSMLDFLLALLINKLLLSLIF